MRQDKLGHVFVEFDNMPSCKFCGAMPESPVGMIACLKAPPSPMDQAHLDSLKPPKKEKPKSRPERWSEACSRAESASCDLRAALDELQSMREEYGEWRDNLPENLQNSALGEKLNTVADLDVDNALASLDEVDSTVDEASNADLPRGFGRD